MSDHLTRRILIVTLATLCLVTEPIHTQNSPTRPDRTRDLGIVVGVLAPGPLNAITDVDGVAVGHTTIVRGNNIRTGVTAVLPHTDNLFQRKVPGAVHIGNAFGKLAGSTQVQELGEIETPILLTSTLSVPRVADAVIDYMLKLPGNEQVRSINPLVAETNDGRLNDIRSRPITSTDVADAIRSASGGPVAEGAIGAGTGTIAFGFKGGIGTASRRVPEASGGYTVGVLVQTNFGGVLTINGAPVGRELGRYYLRDQLESVIDERPTTDDRADGSVIIVVATDAPIDSRNLKRLSARAMFGLARTGAAGSNGSGDYVIAFSTANEIAGACLPAEGCSKDSGTHTVTLLGNASVSPLFLAVIEATEEAIYNSLFRANDMTGQGRQVNALPLEPTLEILRRYGAIREP